jgi:anti-sigma regulatory factor (Ser/Thr protein kinase)
MTTDMQIALPARAENIAIVRHALGALEDAYALDAQTLSDIRLAVTEACTNVVVHAYPDGGEGLGLPLIASLAESVQLGRDERQRTEVRMTFSLNNAPHHYDGAAARNGAGAAQAATATQPVGAATAQANPTDGRAADTGAAAGPATFGATESTGSQ